MKYSTARFVASPVLFLAAGLLTGCYTELGTVRSERAPARDYDRTESAEESYEAPQDSLEYAEEEGTYSDDDYWHYRHRLGFYYYYPSFYVGVGAAYYDPWYWDPWYWRSSAYYYDPFICGTYFPWYYAGWYRPSYWGHYPWYSGWRTRDYAGGGRYSGTRTFGNTRGSGSSRLAGSQRAGDAVQQTPVRGGDLPVGYRSAGSSTRSGTPSSSAPGVSSSRRGRSDGGSGVVRQGTRGKTGSTRSGGSKEGTRIERSSPPPSYQPSPPSRGSGGGRSGEGRSYSPPSSSPSPSSGGGGNSSGGSSRGGSSRGGNRR